MLQFEAVALQSSQRLPELLFYTKKSYRILQLQFYKGTHTHNLQDLPKAFQTFQTFQSFRTFQSFMTFQPSRQFYKVPVFPGNPPHSSILRLECIFYIFYKFYSSIGFRKKLHRVPVEQYKLSTNITFFKEREMLRYRSELTDSPE